MLSASATMFERCAKKRSKYGIFSTKIALETWKKSMKIPTCSQETLNNIFLTKFKLLPNK
jgi:hypothetical protein